MSRWHTTEFDRLPERAFTTRGGRGKFSAGMTLEGGGGRAPPPDPQMGAAALRQVALAERQWADYTAEGGEREWIRGIANEAVGIGRETADRANATSDYQLAQMRRQDDRFWGSTVPMQDRLDADVEQMFNPAGIQRQVDRSLADVGAATSNARGQGLRAMARMGVNPASGAFAAQENAMTIQQAQAMAGAANKTRMAAEQAGLANRFQGVGARLGMAGLGATSAGLAGNFMGTGLNAGGSMMNAGTATVGANNNTFGSTMNGMNAGIGNLGRFNELQQNATRTNNANNPFAALLGAGAQLGATAIGAGWSDRRLKADIVQVGVDETTGLNLYEFRYRTGAARYRGVMADEVEVLRPDAVYEDALGYKLVDYRALGIEMLPVQGETA